MIKRIMRPLQMVTFLVLLVIFPIIFAEAKWINPPCGFTNFKNVKTCSNKNLTRIPTDCGCFGMENGRCFTTLDLGKNKIRSFSQEEIFKIACRGSVQVLYLYHNDISYIPRNALGAFSDLRVLDLSSNKLTYIGHQFCHSSTLTVLILDSNHELQITATSFACLENLERLSLKQCSIRNLPDGFIAGLLKLTDLDLSQNYIINFIQIQFPPNLKLILPDYPKEEPPTSLSTINPNVNVNPSTTTIATNSSITHNTHGNTQNQTSPNQDKEVTQANANLWSTITPSEQATPDNIRTGPRNLHREEPIQRASIMWLFLIAVVVAILGIIAGIWYKKRIASNHDTKKPPDEDIPLNTIRNNPISDSEV